MKRTGTLSLLLGGLLLLVSCGGDAAPEDNSRPVSLGGGAAQPTTVVYDAPDEWIQETPRSSMRKDQFRLPRAEGDAEDAELVVFYFGPGQGGTVEANINRWVGQFSKADGSPVGDAAQVSQRQVNGRSVTILDVSGNYSASMGPMAPAGPAKPGYRALAAVLEIPNGNWFFKLTGPTSTVEKWEDSFNGFIDSIRVE